MVSLTEMMLKNITLSCVCNLYSHFFYFSLPNSSTVANEDWYDSLVISSHSLMGLWLKFFTKRLAKPLLSSASFQVVLTQRIISDKNILVASYSRTQCCRIFTIKIAQFYIFSLYYRSLKSVLIVRKSALYVVTLDISGYLYI